MKNVEFISYTGKFPDLCCGVLTLKINGEVVKFGHEIEDFDLKTGKYNDSNFDECWLGNKSDSVCCSYAGYWKVTPESLPEKYRIYSKEIEDLFNKFVPESNCGGCE